MVELEGDYTFAAPQELLWELLQDPEALARTIPGCEDLERVGDNVYQGRLNLRVGPVQGVFQGRVELSDLQPPSRFRMLVNGHGPAGVVGGEGALQLEADGDTTRLTYDGSVQVSGRIATVGQRLMDSSAKAIVKQSLQNLDKQVQVRLQPAPVAGAVAAEAAAKALPPAPSQAEFMANVAQDVIKDLVPDDDQRRLLLGAGALVGVLVFLNWFANLVARRVVRMLDNRECRSSDNA